MLPLLPKVVFEVGINHNGSLDAAKKIMQRCMLAADLAEYPDELLYFKFQKREPKLAVPKHMWHKPKVHPGTGEEMTYLEYKESMEFSLDQYCELASYSKSLGAKSLFLSVWDDRSIHFATQLNSEFPSKFIKIPSAFSNVPTFVKKVAISASYRNMGTIISTGGMTGREIYESTAILKRTTGRIRSYVLSCTSVYPCPPSMVNLAKMIGIRGIVEGMIQDDELISIGYSHHSPGILPMVTAAAFGAEMIEMHVTLDRSLPGSDQSGSIEFEGVRRTLRDIRSLPIIYGDDFNRFVVYDEELEKLSTLRS